MSDYLWDKTGEAEEDVERLEELLGQLRYQPRSLELPAEAEGFKPAGLRAPTVFRPAWLAVAAVLLLFVLAGALFVMRRGAAVAGSEHQAAARASQDAPRQTPSVAGSGKDEATPGKSEVVKSDGQNGPDGRGEQTAREEQTVKDKRAAQDERAVKDERQLRQILPREPERRPGVGEVASKQGGGMTNAGPRRNEAAAVEPPPAVAASAPLEERQQQAKDELMYALRLTGIKLKDVQKKTQKVDGLRPAFDEQQRIR